MTMINFTTMSAVEFWITLFYEFETCRQSQDLCTNPAEGKRLQYVLLSTIRVQRINILVTYGALLAKFVGILTQWHLSKTRLAPLGITFGKSITETFRNGVGRGVFASESCQGSPSLPMSVSAVPWSSAFRNDDVLTPQIFWNNNNCPPLIMLFIRYMWQWHDQEK